MAADAAPDADVIDRQVWWVAAVVVIGATASIICSGRSSAG